ncbi:MAG: SsrA-binding protein SmpB [Clostridia bacterium]|nr:SsrA-binding protein SmpB [Clostridia bacterium]
MKENTEKVLSNNRSAYHDYSVLEKFEAGIVLTGDEVKSVKNGNLNLKDSFIFAENNSLVIKNMHISRYEKVDGFAINDTRRDRKLLMHKLEVLKISQKVERKGLTLIPLKLYLKGALIKVELGLCQGKHTYDKKKDLMEKDNKRFVERQLKNNV